MHKSMLIPILIMSMAVIGMVLVILSLVRLRGSSVSSRFTGYRLGNMLDAWYGQYYPGSTKRKELGDMIRTSPDTFGSFVASHEPLYLSRPMPPEFIRDNSEFWWSYFYDNVRSVYPFFNTSLRILYDEYRNENPEYKITVPPRTCVIHLRVGDFLTTDHGLLNIDDMVDAVSRFSTIPERFEIMNGGKRHNSNDSSESDRLLRTLSEKIRFRYPETTVSFIDQHDADLDFFRMTEAPMLLTGPGSFAIMAAILNRNERLTPALANLNFPQKGAIDEGHLYEEWFTYRVRLVPYSR